VRTAHHSARVQTARAAHVNSRRAQANRRSGQMHATCYTAGGVRVAANKRRGAGGSAGCRRLQTGGGASNRRSDKCTLFAIPMEECGRLRTKFRDFIAKFEVVCGFSLKSGKISNTFAKSVGYLPVICPTKKQIHTLLHFLRLFREKLPAACDRTSCVRPSNVRRLRPGHMFQPSHRLPAHPLRRFSGLSVGGTAAASACRL